MKPVNSASTNPGARAATAEQARSVSRRYAAGRLQIILNHKTAIEFLLDDAMALITEYQLGLLSETERRAIEYRLETDEEFVAIVTPILFAGDMVRAPLEEAIARVDADQAVERLLARIREYEDQRRKGGADR